MEEILKRFPQIGEKIFLQLSDDDLQNCRRVNKFWKYFIDNPSQKQICIRNVQGYEKCTHLQKYISTRGDWNVLKCEELGGLIKDIKRTKNKYRMELMFLDTYERIGTKLSAYDERGLSILHWYTNEVNNSLWEDVNYPKMVKDQVVTKIMTKLPEFNIDINAKQKYNCKSTALHLACMDGNVEVVKIMMGVAEANDLDFNATCLKWTGLQIAMIKKHQEIVDIISAKLKEKRNGSL